MGNKSLSVIIPHWPRNEELNDLLRRCLKSIKGQAEEIIVIVNDGIGFAKSVNLGLSLANQDFIAVLNNDVVLSSGNLKDLCLDRKICSPVLNGDIQEFWGCCWVMPKEVYEKIGGLDERFGKGYFEDDDYVMRAKEAGYELAPRTNVQIRSEGGKTMNTIGLEKHDLFEKNKRLFFEKWGILPKYANKRLDTDNKTERT